MRIIQSFYAPENDRNLSFKSAYSSPEFHWMSWALSCLSLSKFYSVELYTNSAGKEILIDKLNLPYTKVHLDLDNYKICDEQLWSASKVFVYSLQETPFLHVDGDIFIWQKFDQDFLESPIICQNSEFDSMGFYKAAYQNMVVNDFVVPPQMQELYGNGFTYGYNAGLFGGSDISFIKEYTKTAFELIDSNKNKLNSIPLNMFNVVLEQGVLYCMAKEQKIEVKEFLDFGKDEIWTNYNFSDFLNIPLKTKFIHLIGTKKNSLVCQMLAKQLRKEYPSYYDKILTLCNEHGLSTSVDRGVNIILNSNPYQLSIDFFDKFLSNKPHLGQSYTNSCRARFPLPEYAFRDLLNFENSKIRYQNANQVLAVNDEDQMQYNQMNYVLDCEDNLTKACLSIRSGVVFVNSILNWTHINTIDDYEGSVSIAGNYKMALLINPLFHTVDAIFCDEFITRLLDFIKIDSAFMSVIERIYKYYYHTTEVLVDFRSFDEYELYEYTIFTLKHCIFSGIVSVTVPSLIKTE